MSELLMPRVQATQLKGICSPTTKLPRFFHHPLFRILIAFGFLLPVITINNLFSIFVLDSLSDQVATWVQMATSVLVVWAGMWAYRQYCRRIEGREPFELGTDGWRTEFLLGTTMGMGMILIIVGILYAAGAYTVDSFGSPFVLLVRIFRYGQGSFLEDILFTIIMFRLLEEFAGTTVAYIGISLLFGWMHLWNDNSTYLTSLYIAIQEVTILAPFILTRRLWMTWAVHFGWNYAQTGIFGLNNSGMEHGGFLVPAINGPDWLTGGSFGIEASAVGILINLVVGIPLMILAFRRNQFLTPVWLRKSDT